MVHRQPVYTEYTENLYPPLEQHLSGSTVLELKETKWRKKNHQLQQVGFICTMFGKVFTLVFRECSRARLLVWGYCPQLYLNLLLQNRHCSVIAIIIRFLYLLRTILCLIVSYQYKVWIGRDLEECHDSVDSGPLHMVLCIQLPPPPLSHYLLLCDGWHNQYIINRNTRKYCSL